MSFEAWATSWSAYTVATSGRIVPDRVFRALGGFLWFWDVPGLQGHYPLDNVWSGTTWFDTGNYYGNCDAVDAMEDFAITMGHWLPTIPYNPFFMNSNTGAQLVGVAGNFHPSSPPRAIGWW